MNAPIIINRKHNQKVLYCRLRCDLDMFGIYFFPIKNSIAIAMKINRIIDAYSNIDNINIIVTNIWSSETAFVDKFRNRYDLKMLFPIDSSNAMKSAM